MKQWFKQNYLLFCYLFSHKYHVFRFGLKLGVPLYLLIIHDWTKFLPDEFFAHAAYFFNPNKTFQDIENFKYASLRHINRSPHHWQFWTLSDDYTERLENLEIPLKYTKELVADWAAAGYVKHGKIEVKSWYYKNKYKIHLHKSTRKEVEKLLNKYF